MYVTPSTPQPVGGVIDDAIRLYRHSFARCWLLGLLPALLFGAFMIAVAIAFPTYNATVRFGGTQALPATSNFRAALIFGDLVLVLLALGFQGATTAYQAALARADDSFTLGRALATGFVRIPTLILSLLLLYLGMIGVMLAALIVLLPVGLTLSHFHLLGQSIAGAGLAIGFGIAVVYVLGRLQLFMPAIFIDHKGGKAALTTSWYLTKGQWWRAAAILGVGIAIILIIYLAVALLNYVVGYVIPFDKLVRVGIGTSVLVACYTFVYPMYPALWVAMYNDFKLRREGGDLVARVGALNSA